MEDECKIEHQIFLVYKFSLCVLQHTTLKLLDEISIITSLFVVLDALSLICSRFPTF